MARTRRRADLLRISFALLTVAVCPWIKHRDMNCYVSPASGPRPSSERGSTSLNTNCRPIVVKELRLWNEFENYEINEVVGTGGWGKVYSAMRKSDHKKVALKFFGYTSQCPVMNSINSEVMLMMSLIGVHGVVQMESLFYDTPEGFVDGKNRLYLQSYPVIVMEMVTGGELFHRIKYQVDNNKIPSELYLANMFQSVILALGSIHRRNYIHRDLKLDNLLLVSHEDNSPIKIIDFGCMVQLPLGQHVYRRQGELAGTPGCYAPESLLHYEYSFKSDVWQAGCILYRYAALIPFLFLILFSLLCGHPPFYAEAKYRPYIVQGKFCQSPQWKSLSLGAKDLIQRMLEVDPERRISISEILRHEWMTGRAAHSELGKDYADRVYKLALRERLKKIFLKWESREIHSSDGLHDQSEVQEHDVHHSRSLPSATRIGSSHSHDSNHSSSLSSLSAPPLLPRHHFNPGPHRIITSHLNNSKWWFDLLDKDKDGSITREELIEGIIGMLYEDDEFIEHKLHHREDNTLSEVSSFTGCPAVHVNVEELFLVMDRNCSGTIDYQEFTHFYDMILQSSTMKLEREFNDDPSDGVDLEHINPHTPSHPTSTSCDTPLSFPDFDYCHSDSSTGTSREGRKRKDIE